MELAVLTSVVVTATGVWRLGVTYGELLGHTDYRAHEMVPTNSSRQMNAMNVDFSNEDETRLLNAYSFQSPPGFERGRRLDVA